MTWPSHGANPHYLYEAAGLTRLEQMIDFSANINPLGPPVSIQRNWGSWLHGIVQYPDPQSSLLKKKLAGQNGIETNNILIGNGGAEIISLIGRLFAGKKVLIVEPTFSEYEKVCQINHCDITYFQLMEGWELDTQQLIAQLSKVDVVFLCNPNNPTGCYYGKDKIKEIVEECEKQNCYLIVDEAFYDFVAQYESLVSILKEYSTLIMLRSLTKIFAIPGLRLGYVMADPKIIENLADYQPHWSVNSIAMKAGELFLEDEDFIQKSIQHIDSERETLFSFYKKRDFVFSESKVNFYLLRDTGLINQYPFFQFLLGKGIVPRHTFNFPGLEGKWLRFAIKRTEENMALMEAVQEWRNIHPSSL